MNNKLKDTLIFMKAKFNFCKLFLTPPTSFGFHFSEIIFKSQFNKQLKRNLHLPTRNQPKRTNLYSPTSLLAPRHHFLPFNNMLKVTMTF